MKQAIDVQALAAKLVTIVDETVDNFSKHYVETKSDGSVVTALDYALDTAVRHLVQSEYPEYGFLSEEMAVSERTQVLSEGATAGESFWCLDPLDGTSNYANGIPFWCVSLALINNKHAHIGIIYDYERKECFVAARGHGVWMNGKALSLDEPATELQHCIANIDYKRLADNLALNLLKSQNAFRSQRNFGSCALEWCWLAMNRIQVYLHGGMKLWDYAAGSLILQEAGGYSSNLAGQPVFNPEASKSAVVAAVSQSLFEVWYKHLAQCSDMQA